MLVRGGRVRGLWACPVQGHPGGPGRRRGDGAPQGPLEVRREGAEYVSRRAVITRRPLDPDPVYNSALVQMVNKVLKSRKSPPPRGGLRGARAHPATPAATRWR